MSYSGLNQRSEIQKIVARHICHDRRQLSFEDISEITGMPARTVKAFCNAEGQLPLESLQKLAEVYKTTVDWLADLEPRLQVWKEFQLSGDFKNVNTSPQRPSSRLSAIFQWVTERYSGHMQIQDLCDRHIRLGFSIEDLRSILEGTREPTSVLCGTFEQLWGLPKNWLILGDQKTEESH